MARTTTVHITDDIDGSTDAEEVSFGYAGTEYVIDLGKKNRAALEKALRPYLDVARKAAKSGSSRRSRTAAAPTRDLNSVREWAKEQGIEVSERGRVAKAVLDKYDASH